MRLQEVAEKVEKDDIGSYIAHHSDPMSNALFGMHLPHFELPSYLSFLNNVKDAQGNFVSFQLTAHMVIMLVVAFLLLSALAFLRRNGRLTALGHVFEVLVLYVRDEIAKPNLAPHLVSKMTPFLCTLFFYILFMNFIGMIPGSATATSNVMVTASMAVVVFFLIEYMSIKELGFKHYLKHMTVGTAWPMWFIIVPVELMGKFAKPFALLIRLFANMTAGHIVIIAFLGLIGQLNSLWVAGFSVPMALFVNLLEILVALLQAFIFTMLTAVFLGLATQHEHEEEHEVH